MSLFVGNLSPHAQHRELENTFRRFGRSNLELKDGYGFIVYEEYRDAERALKALQGRSICGERPSISWAKRRLPLQRFSAKGTFRRDSLDKDQDQAARRQPSLKSDKVSSDDGKDQKVADKVKDITTTKKIREDRTETFASEEEWHSAEKMTFEEKTKDWDPLDSGRWGEPVSEGSPEHMVGDGSRDYKKKFLDSKEKEDAFDSVHELSRGSPVHKSVDERPSRSFRNSDDQFKRRRDALGKPQERCFNCGHLGHAMRQCRLRIKMKVYPREGFDGRRTQFRNLRGAGFRGTGGRFRGMDGPRRVLNRDMEGNYGRRNLRRPGYFGDRRLFKHVEMKFHDKSRQRHHSSDSQKSSPSRNRSEIKHKKSSTKTLNSKRKRRKSSSDLSSASRSVSLSSSSSPSHSRSHSRSWSHFHSLSHSLASRSRSSKSHSMSLSSVPHSDRSLSQSSRSCSVSASSRSRSRSGSSCSEKSPVRSHSRSSKSRSRSVSQSSATHHFPSLDSTVLPSKSLVLLEDDSPFSHSDSREWLGSSSRIEAEELASKYMSGTDSEWQEKRAIGVLKDAETGKKDNSKYSSEGADINEQHMKRTEKQRHRFRESKAINDENRSDGEEFYRETEKLSNGGKDSIKQESFRNEHSSRGDKHQDQIISVLGRFVPGQAGSKVSEPPPSPFLGELVQGDLTYSPYGAVVKEPHKGFGHTQNFDVARLWPWDAILYRHLKRGPISTANYERRKLQNEEFGIEDKFVRSSSGWWENRAEFSNKLS